MLFYSKHEMYVMVYLLGQWKMAYLAKLSKAKYQHLVKKSSDSLKFLVPNWRHYAGNHCDYASLEAVWWCSLYYYFWSRSGVWKKKEKSAEVADFSRCMWSTLPISITSRPLWPAAVLQKIAFKALCKVFNNIHLISDVEFLISAAVSRTKEMQFLLSEIFFSFPYTTTPTRFGALHKTSKCLAGIMFSLSSWFWYKLTAEQLLLMCKACWPLLGRIAKRYVDTNYY